MNPERFRNIKIGIFAVVAFALLCFGLNYLKCQNFFQRGVMLTACFASVDGLTDSSPVIYNGFKVGSVRDIEIDQYATDPNRRFTVTIGMEKKLDVPSDSRAEIVSTDLLGGKGIELMLGVSKDLASGGDTLASSIRTGLMEQLMPVKDQASSLMTSADDVFRSIDTLLNQNNRQNIDVLIAEAAVAMKNLEVVTRNLSQLTAQTGALQGTFNSTNQLMTSLSGQTGKIDTIMQNATEFTNSLAAADAGHLIGQIDSTMVSLNNMLSANGNIAKLANDTTFYTNMTAAIENLNRLLVDIRLNPSRYINVSAFKFGGKQIYFADASAASNVMRGEVYAVCLDKAKEPKDVAVTVGSMRVMEYMCDGRYRYIVVPFVSKAEAEQFMTANNIGAAYPDAEVERYVDGVRK